MTAYLHNRKKQAEARGGHSCRCEGLHGRHHSWELREGERVWEYEQPPGFVLQLMAHFLCFYRKQNPIYLFLFGTVSTE